MTQPKFKIRKGDLVEVITGRDKGKRGEVIRVIPREARVVVQGVNIRKKHIRSYTVGGQTVPGRIVEFEAPIHISNLMLVCPQCNRPVRVRIRRENKRRIRICKRCGTEIG